MTSYTLFGQGAGPGSIDGDTSAQTLAVQFSVSQAMTLSGIWFYSPSGAGVLPQNIALYQVTGAGTGTLVNSQAASWSGAAGSGWVRASFGVALTSSTNYKACVNKTTSGGGNTFYNAVNNYWSSGAGGSGITNGPLSAPNNAGADVGQDSFHSGATLAYPASTFSSGNYWVDPEVATIAASAGMLMAGEI